MVSIKTSKEFNQQLNQSYDFIEKYHKWAPYRDAISHFVMKQTPAESQCLLVGAGYCNDVDLVSFLDHFPSIFCVDIDAQAILLGLHRQGLAGTQKIHPIEADISGLPDSFFIDVNQMIACGNLSGLKQYLNAVEPNPAIPELIDQRFDVVLVSALYSQLILPQVLSHPALQNNQSLFESVSRLLLDFMPAFLQRLNSLFHQLTKPGGRLIAWSDLLEFRATDPIVRDLASHIDDTEFIDGFYDSYVAQFGHGVSSYGMDNLYERLKVIESRWLLWPFDDARTFLVKLTAGQKEL